MDTKFVKATVDVHCRWKGQNPQYRLFVNDELFCERTWIWRDCYLREILQIAAPPGEYKIRLVALPHANAVFKCKNPAIEQGSARWLDDFRLLVMS
jgi:hypothetical protein